MLIPWYMFKSIGWLIWQLKMAFSLKKKEVIYPCLLAIFLVQSRRRRRRDFKNQILEQIITTLVWLSLSNPVCLRKLALRSFILLTVKKHIYKLDFFKNWIWGLIHLSLPAFHQKWQMNKSSSPLSGWYLSSDQTHCEMFFSRTLCHTASDVFKYFSIT